jgi:hypothetical protein
MKWLGKEIVYRFIKIIGMRDQSGMRRIWHYPKVSLRNIPVNINRMMDRDHIMIAANDQ